MNQPKALVVFFSRTQTTKRVAERISALAGADLEEIIDYENRLGLRGYVYSAIDATFERSTPIHPLTHDPAAYDVVLVGTPVWNASVSAPVRRFLEEHGRKLRSVAFFCTMAGRGSERAFRQMRKICNTQPRAVLALRGMDVHRGLVRIDLETFVSEATRGDVAVHPLTNEQQARAFSPPAL